MNILVRPAAEAAGTGIVGFIHGLAAQDLPQEIVSLARACLLDLAGTAAAGRATRMSAAAHDFAAQQMGAGAGGAHLLFDGRRANAAAVAFAGAATIDSFDAHDGHPLTKGHSGVAVLPALLAVADAGRIACGSDELLASLVMGYEIAIRAGIALHRTACDYHTSGAWNALACAAVAARLLRLSPEATREALGIAEFHGPRSQMMRCIDHPTMVKDGSAWGAMAGVSAAFLAQAGFTGAPAITMEAPEVADLWADLGTRWRIAEQYFKPVPVCRWAQPAMRAAAELVALHHVNPSEIASVTIETFAAAVRLGLKPPATTEQAQYALGFPVASFLAHGQLGPREVAEEALDHPATLALLGRMQAVVHPDYEAAFPARRIAQVTLRLADGRSLVSPPTRAHGDADDPMSLAEIEAKFALNAAALEPSRRSSLAAAIARLGAADGPDADALLALLAPPFNMSAASPR